MEAQGIKCDCDLPIWRLWGHFPIHNGAHQSNGLELVAETSILHVGTRGIGKQSDLHIYMLCHRTYNSSIPQKSHFSLKTFKKSERFQKMSDPPSLVGLTTWISPVEFPFLPSHLSFCMLLMTSNLKFLLHFAELRPYISPTNSCISSHRVGGCSDSSFHLSICF